MRTRFILATTWGTFLAATPTVCGGGRDDAAAESLGWRLSLQCWTFNDVTTFESIDRAKTYGLKYIELYPGQKLRPDGDAKTSHDMPAEERTKLIDKLKSAGIRAVNYGVVNLTGEASEDRRVFEFAKALGIETINSEPTPEALDAIDKLAGEYKINVALHNHPKGSSRYWDPAYTHEIVSKHSPRIGLCADLGHWVRSGIDPVEALKKYGDRVITFHVKDLSEFGKNDAKDIVWGTGVSKLKEVMAQLKTMKFKGALSIEYEDHPANQQELVGKCISFFDKAAGELGKK